MKRGLFLCLAVAAPLRAAAPAFPLTDPGGEEVLNYAAYGKFQGVGTFDFKYVLTDPDGLSRAAGIGIDPNTEALKDERYQALKRDGRLKPSYWQHVNSGDPEADFYAWATARTEEPGVRLLFTAKALERAGHWSQALKAYHAVMVMYPRSYCWSKDHSFTWLVAPVAWDAVINLLRRHPELKLKLEGADVRYEASIGGDPSRNRVAVRPGRFVKAGPRRTVDPRKLKVVERRGGRVACVKYANGHWGLQVGGKPFVVKAVSYQPTKVGWHLKDWNWMTADEDNDGANDPGEESWVDENANGRQDAGEKAAGDFELIHDMGANAIRLMADKPLNLPLLRRMHQATGLYVILTDPFGAYTLHSGADWSTGTDYRDVAQRRNMLSAVKEMVLQSKGEPWLLAYVLGNENNISGDYTGVNATRTNAAAYPEAYASLLNEAASLIHQLDPNHPVGVGNMGLGLLDSYARLAQGLDFIGVNSYAGEDGFGALWTQVKSLMDRPVLVTEFGCDAYWEGRGPDEDAQARYLSSNWEDIATNAAGGPGAGAALGGSVFEWLDEWWKDTRADPRVQDTVAGLAMAFPDNVAHEEWFGIMSQGQGNLSPFLRRPRKAYDALRKIWTH